MQVPVIHKAHLFGCKLLKTFHWYSGEKRAFSWASYNLAAEQINTNVTSKYPIRAHLYSIILWGLPLFGCNLEHSSSHTVYNLYNTLNLKMCVQETLSQCLELFLGVIPLGTGCFWMWYQWGKRYHVQQDAEDASLTWNDRELVCEQNSCQNC